MRFPRSALIARWPGGPDSRSVLLEAPAGFGKSWLLRRLAPRGAVPRRGSLGPEPVAFDSDEWLVVDDAHLLSDDELGQLIAIVEDAGRPVALATRLAPEPLRMALQFADGLHLGVADLAVDAAEIHEALAETGAGTGAGAIAAVLDDGVIERLLDVTDGEIAVVSATLDELAERSAVDPVMSALQQRRNSVAETIRGLAPLDRSLVGALARVPMLDRRGLERLGGADTVTRLVNAGVPLQRMPGGLLALVSGANSTVSVGFEQAAVDEQLARELAGDLLARGEVVAGVTLLLDAGASVEAANALGAIGESDAEGIGADTLLMLLGRLGAVVDVDPRLLLLRSMGNALLGRETTAITDVERAAALADADDAPESRAVARRAHAYLGLRLAFADMRDEASAAAERALAGIGPGEDATLARAHLVRATLAQAEDSREGLQLAAEEYRLAAGAWEAAGQQVNARYCRSDLAMAALCPLGRFDEALAIIAELLAVADVTAAERSWYLLNEGFALVHANRLDRAAARFTRVSDLSRVQHNPRLAAAAAWGLALVAAGQGDLPETLRRLTQAENTALGDEDTTLGVPFLADAAVALGALGADDLARRYFERAEARQGVYYSYVGRARFIVEARAGTVGDHQSVEAHLARTPPAEWWRVLLVAADAAARRGDLALASEWLRRAEYELLGLGLGGFEAVGETRTFRRLRGLLDGAGTPDGGGSEHQRTTAPATTTGRAPARRRDDPAAGSAAELRICVFGTAMVVHRTGAAGDEVFEVPAGNPQRLAGVVVANEGVATFDQLSEALWPGDDIESTRPRLRNVLMRLRKAVGDVVTRSGNGIRLAPGATSDLAEFDRIASDALTSLRSDPDLAGRLAAEAVAIAEGPLFADFEYDDWAEVARRRTEQQLLTLLDLLSVQAEDEGDLGRAQQLAERALRLDRYSDSRRLRLADLFILDGKKARGMAVLAEGREVAQELGGTVSEEIERRRAELGRQA